MKDGVVLYLSSQTILKTYSGELISPATEPLGKNDVYESKKPSPIVPNFYGIYKKDNYAVFVGAGLIAGGGSVDYKDGVAMMVLTGAQNDPMMVIKMETSKVRASIISEARADHTR